MTGLYEIPIPYFYSEIMGEGNREPQYGAWGLDSVYLGNSARDVSSATYVATTLNADFVVASFGLAAGAVGPSGAARPTMLTLLSQRGDIPGNSYSYTAGSARRKLSSC